MKVPHGGNIWAVAKLCGLHAKDMIDFSANVTPLGLSPTAKERIKDSIDLLSNYPDPSADELIDCLSAYHGVDVEHIAVGNGSSELLYLIPRVLQPKRALIIEPAFGEYARSLELAGCSVEKFQTLEAGSFRLDIDALIECLKEGEGFDILYMANPASPTGVLTSKAQMERILEACVVEGTTFIVDEAFCDFTEPGSMKSRVASSDQLVVMRSMTKFFGLAGLRLGLMMASERMVVEVSERKVPWSINTLAMAAGCGSLEDTSHIEKVRQWFKDEHAFMSRELASIEGITLFDSSANFFMLKIDPLYGTGPMLRERLLKDRIIIRALTEFAGLGENFVRVSIRTRENNIFLIDRLKAALKELAPGRTG
ncbi:MAG: threonine-phosphate decarboxylase CobD [Thermodesulfobacteriota bacterium]